MNSRLFILIFCILSLNLSAQQNSLWYKNSANTWNEALPIGNGSLGAMVYGGISQERIQLNEESIWSHQGSYLDKKGGHKYIDVIRNLLFEGKYKEAEDLTREKLMADRLPSGTNAYQTMGELLINFGEIENVKNYRRELKLDSALIAVSFLANKTRYKRKYFASYPDKCLVGSFQAEGDEKMNCSMRFNRAEGPGSIFYTDSLIRIKHHVAGGKGVKFEAMIEMRAHSGSLSVQDSQILISESDDFEIRVFAASDYRGDDPGIVCAGNLKKAKGRSWADLYSKHFNDYHELFSRVAIDLGHSQAEYFATDERLDAMKRGVYDPGLQSLYFNFGRYLLISSSRPGSLPANLQGIWNDQIIPPWNSDYHININVQMNYWPSELCNLSECHLPFLEFVGQLRKHGKETAKELYGCDGFTAHHTTDAWHYTTSFGLPQYGMWPMGAAWAATHIWEHYLFTGDEDFLSNYGYEVMKEAALFLSDYLVEHPETGRLVTGPSMSPENVFIAPDGSHASISMGPAMDLQIVWHLFHCTIEASKTLHKDKAFRRKLEKQLERLTKVKIGEDGRILEWSDESLEELWPGHRHISHLYGLHPSFQYNYEDSPEYMDAAAKVLEYRLKHGGGHTGWSRAWIINFYARLKNPEKAYENVLALLRKSTLTNMFDNHPPFQIDGNFGGTAGIAEMLLQSHSGIIEVLPCLPKAWHTGSVGGLMARGGFEISMKWKDLELTELKLISKLGKPLKIRFGDQYLEQKTEKGQVIELL